MEVKIEVEKEESEGPKKWEIEGWARTIIEAEQIKADAEKMALVKPELEKMAGAAKGAIKSIKGLKAKANKLAMEEDEE